MYFGVRLLNFKKLSFRMQKNPQRLLQWFRNTLKQSHAMTVPAYCKHS